MENMTMKLKTNIWELPNKMHFDVQRTTRSHTFKTKKGKGSYSRKNQNTEY